jgi:hypothetical protein
VLAREAERRLILDQEIGESQRLGFTRDRDPASQEGQFGDMNGRRADPSAQRLVLSGEQNRGIVGDDRDRRRFIRPVRRTVLSTSLRTCTVGGWCRMPIAEPTATAYARLALASFPLMQSRSSSLPRVTPNMRRQSFVHYATALTFRVWPKSNICEQWAFAA